MTRLGASAILLLLMILSAAVVSGCGDDDRAEGPAQADVDNEPPYGPGVTVGETYDYGLYTHCGIEWARIDGVWWRTPPLDDGNANPPPGWGNPYDAGRLVIDTETTATYTSDAGTAVELERTGRIEAPFACE